MVTTRDSDFLDVSSIDYSRSLGSIPSKTFSLFLFIIDVYQSKITQVVKGLSSGLSAVKLMGSNPISYKFFLVFS